MSATKAGAGGADALAPWPGFKPAPVRESVTSGKIADSREALAGTLVHRLFQYAIRVNDDASLDEVAERAQTLLRPEERAVVEDPVALCRQAASGWHALRRRPDVTELFEAAQCRYEVPFSVRLPGDPERILRGSIDCLVRRSDGTFAVVEIKTGRPRPEHAAQLDVYVQAARELCGQPGVDGVLVYSE